MYQRFTRTLLVAALAAAPAAAQDQRAGEGAQPARPARPAPTSRAGAPARNAIDPQADQVLRRMSNYLAGLQSFRVDTNAVDEMVTRQGERLQNVSESRISVRRPNMVRSERVGAVADVVFRYDGRQFSLVGNRTGFYATAEAPPTLDAAVETLRARYGMEVPAADLLTGNPYENLMENTTSGTYLGLEPVHGTPTHHLAFRGRDVDWQIWVQDGAEPVPRRFTIISKTEPSHPEFSVEMSNWDPRARISDDEFAFRPPQNGRRIEMLSAPGQAPGREGRMGR